MTEHSIDTVLEEAACWMAHLQSGHVSDIDAQAFQAWHDSHPVHAQVFRRMSDGVGLAKPAALRTLSDDLVIRTLSAPSSRRRFLQGSLGALAVVGVTSAGLKLSLDGFAVPGELSTGTAERRSFALQDGSRLTLNAQSRVRLAQDPARPALYLYQGALQLQCSRQPLRVETPAASAEVMPEGQVLIERHPEGEVKLTVIARQVRLQTARHEELWIKAGQSARLPPSAHVQVGRADPAATAWLSGLLEAQGRPLGEVIEALRVYRHGVIRVSPQAAQLRVSGLYPLDDPARALRLIAASLPINVISYGSLWVSIELA